MKKQISRSALLVDDDPLVQHILGAILEAYAISCKVKASGRECLDFIENIPNIGYSLPDVIFLDVLLGDMSGIEVLASLHKILPTPIPVVMLSGNPENEVLELCQDFVPDYFLEKPFVSESVKSILDKIFS